MHSTLIEASREYCRKSLEIWSSSSSEWFYDPYCRNLMSSGINFLIYKISFLHSLKILYCVSGAIPLWWVLGCYLLDLHNYTLVCIYHTLDCDDHRKQQAYFWISSTNMVLKSNLKLKKLLVKNVYIFYDSVVHSFVDFKMALEVSKSSLICSWIIKSNHTF